MNENNKKINTRNLIALCHIIDDFKEYEKKLLIVKPLIKYKHIYQLSEMSKGKLIIGARKVKKFYEKNKLVIDTINKYSNVITFINQNYRESGVPEKDLTFFHKYLLKNKEEIPKILVLLEKLNELGIEKIEFNEDLDFTKEEYDIHLPFDRNLDLTYVANPQVIPNYVNDIIKFKTVDSNYKIKLELCGLFEYKKISEFSRKIILNSLLFEPNTLPEKLDKEHTFEHLLKLKNGQKEKTTLIRNSVDLSVNISDLEKDFNYTNEIAKKLNGAKNKEEFVEVLTSIKEDIEKLKALSKEYNESISQEDSLLTPELLEKEKSLYLSRRYWSSIDFC